MTRSKFNLELDNKIISTLKNGSLSTKEITKALSLDRAKIYRRCCWLEKHGFLKSTIETRTGLFCLDDMEVVTSECYQDCVDNNHDLRSSSIRARIWELAVLSESTSN